MSDKSKPAFPQDLQGRRGDDPWLQGITLREYAAIKLRVPDSGDAELDAMILESRKLDYAGFAMQGLISCPDTTDMSVEDCASYSVDYAHALIAELEREDSA
jgi:hypothetical protein